MVGKAAEAAGIDRNYHYYWLKSDESYRPAFEQARQMAGDIAEDEIRRRGIEGFDHPIIHGGKITGSYKAYSDKSSDVLLEGTQASYRDNQAGISFQGPTQINVVIKDESQKKLSDE